jgi:hypothetical protein
MKYMETFYLILLFFPFLLQAQIPVKFDEYFMDQTFRIDYFHTGEAKSELVTIDHIYRYGTWAGSRTQLLDSFNNGRYYAKVYDLDNGSLIFSRGFDSYFGEYKTSDWALQGIPRTYHETILMPVPLKKVRLSLEVRDRGNHLQEFFTCTLDPEDIGIIRENIVDVSVKVVKSHWSGDSHSRVDIVILGEGYTDKEEDKFNADLKRFTRIFLNYPPYVDRKDKFNIYGVFKPSMESGVDEPDAGIFKSTVLNATFNSLGSERYLLTEDNKSMRDLAAHVPYDAVVIMVNHTRYGGGGIYNLFCTFTADNQWHEYLFLHEFGHSFAGLADEYYTSDVAYNEFYPQGVEPVEVNITALLAPKNVKWKSLAKKDVTIPTPWEKSEYDAMDLVWQTQRRQMNKQITEMKRNRAPYTEIKKAQDEYDTRDRSHADELDAYLKKSRYNGVVGAFEGAGYASKGLYRSMLDCIMFSKGTKPFCKICEQGILKVMEHYIE